MVLPMQEKKRYLLVSFKAAAPLSKAEASRLVSQSVIECVGELGASRAKAFLKEFDEANQSGVVKCQTAMLDEVIASLALKTVVDSGPVAIRVTKISGAIGKVWAA